MGIVVRFPVHRGAPSKAGSFAANAAKSSALSPACRATSEAKIRDQRSAGIELRNCHLRAACTETPMSEAMTAGDFQSAITSRKEVGEGFIAGSVGHSVLKCKAETSYDIEKGFGNNPAMDRMSETEETLAFIRRTRAAREAKFETQKPVYSYLGVPQTHYKHWETKRPMPRRFIPKFCTICEVSMEWLLTGEGAGPKVENMPPKVEKRTSRRPKARAA